MQWKRSHMIYWSWVSLACTVAWRQDLWPVFELWCFPDRQRFIVLDSAAASALCLYSGVRRSLSALVVAPQQKKKKGWKMLALCFICLSGSDVPPPGDAKHWLDFNPSPLGSAPSLFSSSLSHCCCTRAGAVHRLSEVSFSTPAETPALIEPPQDEVMTESCPRPLSLDLQLKWSRLNGRVH